MVSVWVEDVCGRVEMSEQVSMWVCEGVREWLVLSVRIRDHTEKEKDVWWGVV